MGPFEYVRVADPVQAVAMVTADPAAVYLAGGTTQLDLILKDGLISPRRLVDVTRLPLKGITAGDTSIQVGATTTMEELAAILGEELSLPRIEPRGKKNIVTERDKYTSIRQVGPESLRHFKRTYKRALRR